MAGQLNKALGTYSFNPMAAGSKKYSGGTAPTRGALPKAGYIDREKRNHAKVTAYKRWIAAKGKGQLAGADVQKLGQRPA